MRLRMLLLMVGLWAGLFGVTVGEAADGRRCLELRTYYLLEGHLDDLSRRVRDRMMPLFAKHGIESVGSWVSQGTLDVQLVLLLSSESRQARDEAWRAMVKDPDWQEAGGEVGRWVKRVENVFLEPTDFSPDLVIRPGGISRVYELRVCTAFRGRRGALSDHYRNAGRRLFEKYGVGQVGYWVPARDQKGAEEVLVYLLSYRDVRVAGELAPRMWEDSEWLKAKRAAEEKVGGALTVQGGERSVLLMPTEYSALR